MASTILSRSSKSVTKDSKESKLRENISLIEILYSNMFRINLYNGDFDILVIYLL